MTKTARAGAGNSRPKQAAVKQAPSAKAHARAKTPPVEATRPPLARTLTHVDRDGRPGMVDVSNKVTTAREATAECRVRFPAAVAAQLHADGLRSAKGGIVDTAVIAGTMAVKRTHELIPFCHPLPIDGIRLQVAWHGERELCITCAVRTVHRTGVEMEALTGATVAALTVYDMCKALSHAIVLGPARLLSKRGGKRDIAPGGTR